MKIHSQDVVKKKVSDLIPYERNPNIHPTFQIEQIKNSIREWGFTIPIVIDENSTVLAGHGRLYAVQELEMEEIPCIGVEGWTEQQKQAYVIADNKLSEGSDWDMDLFYDELKKIIDNGFDLSLMGFDPDFVLDFEPNLNPTSHFNELDISDIEKAKNNLSDNIDGITNIHDKNGIEVMCPYCAETFRFTGT